MACNLNCLFCRRQNQLEAFYRDHRELPDQKYMEIVEEAVALGVKAINIKGGGEPLIRRALMRELVPLIRRNKVHGSLITNGTLLDEPLAELMVRWEWNELSVSLDSPEAATHDYLRDKPGTFDRLMAGQRWINEFKRRHKAALPHVKWHSVLTNRNHRRVADMLRLAAENGAAEVEFDSLDLSEPSSAVLKLDEGDVREFQEGLPPVLALAERLGIRHNLQNFDRRDYAVRGGANGVKTGDKTSPAPGGSPYERIPCFFPWFHCDITPDGSLVPCCYGEGYESRENLHRMSFREAWRGRGMKEYRDSMRDGTMKPFCRNCTACYRDQNDRIREALRCGPAGDAPRREKVF